MVSHAAGQAYRVSRAYCRAVNFRVGVSSLELVSSALVTEAGSKGTRLSAVEDSRESGG